MKKAKPSSKGGHVKGQSKPIAIDLFCGCGGLTLGLNQAGFRVIGAVEVDRRAAQTYKVNHKNVEVWECDIRALAAKALRRKLHLKKGELDLLARCPPCQGFSTLRTLNRGREVEDEQNDLVFKFLRFIKGLMPKTVMMENVPGLLKDKRLKIFRKQLKELGYTVKCDVLDAADYGVPQRRKRMILLASRDGQIERAIRPCSMQLETCRQLDEAVIFYMICRSGEAKGL